MEAFLRTTRMRLKCGIEEGLHHHAIIHFTYLPTQHMLVYLLLLSDSFLVHI